MALPKAKKGELIASYTDALSQAGGAVYVSFKGLPVVHTEALRRKLKDQGHQYSVVKKTLWKRAVDASSIAGEAPEISGELAVLLGQDVLAGAKTAYEFSKLHKGSFAILGGIWNKEYKNAVEMTQLATIPSREVLLSQLAYLLISPIQRTAIALSQVANKKQ